MNTLGRLFSLQIYGSSHGEELGVLINGCPAGLPLATKDFDLDIKRRQPQGPATTPRKEDDRPLLKSGIFQGHNHRCASLDHLPKQKQATQGLSTAYANSRVRSMPTGWQRRNTAAMPTGAEEATSPDA